MKKLLSIVGLVAVVANLGIATVFAQVGVGEQQISCPAAPANISLESVLYASNDGIAFDSIDTLVFTAKEANFEGSAALDLTNTTTTNTTVDVNETTGLYFKQNYSGAPVTATECTYALEYDLNIDSEGLQGLSGTGEIDVYYNGETIEDGLATHLTPSSDYDLNNAFEYDDSTVDFNLFTTQRDGVLVTGTYTGDITFTVTNTVTLN